MQGLAAAAGRIARRVVSAFLKIGPADEPVAWLSVVATGLLAYQEANVNGLGVEDALVGAAIAAVTVLVRQNVTPAAHLDAAGQPTARYVELPKPVAWSEVSDA